jgi:hypothetical protein
LGVLFTAWATYLTVIGLIYSISQKAEEFLSEGAVKAVSKFSGTTPITNTLEGLRELSTTIVDRLLRFKKDGAFYRPSGSRAILLSALTFFLVSYPLRDLPIMSMGIPFIPGLFTLHGAFDFEFSDLILFTFGVGGLLITINVLSDYLSFSKTRTLIAVLKSVRSPYREAAILCLDVLLSIVIALIVSAAISAVVVSAVLDEMGRPVFKIVSVVAPCCIFTFLAARRLSVITVVFINLFVAVLAISIANAIVWDIFSLSTLYYSMIGGLAYFPGAFLFSCITGLAISLISILGTSLGLIQSIASRFENKGIWRLLNFEKKPMQSSAVVIIVVFTVVYWPIVLVRI